MVKKILKCEYTKHWNHFPIIQLQIEKIWQSVPAVDFLPLINKPFKKNLINDIKNNGMHFPIMVVKSNHKELLEGKEKFGEKVIIKTFEKPKGFIARKLSSSVKDPVEKLVNLIEEKSMWQKFGL